MTIESHEPSRLLEEDELDAHVRSLLVAGRTQQPPLQALRAAPAAVAALLAAQAITHGAAAAPLIAAAPLPHAGAAATFGTLFKWVGIGLVAGFSAAGATAAATSIGAHGEPETRPTPVVVSTGAAGRAVGSAAAVSVESSTPPTMTERAPSAPLTTAAEPRPPRDTVEREVRLLDDARAALSTGRAELALQSLDQAARLPRPLLEPEAAVLRVRALLLLQRRAEAERVARSWESRAPHSPQVSVLHKLLHSPPRAIQTVVPELP